MSKEDFPNPRLRKALKRYFGNLNFSANHLLNPPQMISTDYLLIREAVKPSKESEPLNMIEKVLGAYSSVKSVRRKIDGALIQSYTGARIGCKALLVGAEDGRDYGVPPENIYIVDDHVVTSPDSIYSRAQNVERMLMRKIGGNYIPRGNGPLHYYAQEHLMKPMECWISADSHGPQNAALGVLVEPCGGAKLLRALIDGWLELDVPPVLLVQVEGKLGEFCTARDAAIHLALLLQGEGIRGEDYAFEFFGEGWMELEIEERSTICNLSVDMGAKMVIAPADEKVRTFLCRNSREEDFTPLLPDEGAKYSSKVILKLNEVEPMVVLPSHGLEGATPVRKLGEEVVVDGVRLESCTNSSFHDIREFHSVMEKAKRGGWSGKFHEDVRVSITPGSKSTLEQMLKSGIFEDIVAAGGVIFPPSCGGCIGVLEKPDDLDTVLTTAPRSHQPGRLGSKARGITAGPKIAAMAAIFGRVLSPERLLDKTIYSPSPHIDERRINKMREELDGAISKAPLEYFKMDGTLIGTAYVAENLSTDDISPGDKGLRRIKMGEMRKSFFLHIFPELNHKAKEGSCLGDGIFSLNFGIGASTREIAAEGIRELQLVPVGVRWGKTLYENLINIGVPPLTIKEDDYYKVSDGDRVSFDFLKKEIINHSKGIRIPFTLPNPNTHSGKILWDGGLSSYIRKAIKRKRENDAC